MSRRVRSAHRYQCTRSTVFIVRVSTSPGNHPAARVRQSASATGGPPGSIPAARAGAADLPGVLRSTPKLAASSFCDRPAYQWVKILETGTVAET